MSKPETFDIIVVGGGLAGLTMVNALTIKNQDKSLNAALEIALVAPEFVEPDGRTTALLANSIDFLKSLDVWDQVEKKAARMAVMRLIDDTGRLLHAPETAFKSVEIGLDAFGYNIMNKDLSSSLNSNLKDREGYKRFKTEVTQAIETADYVELTLQSGKKIRSGIVIGADGRNSLIRMSASNGNGIKTRTWSYPQTAIVLNLTHTLPHNDESTEFHNVTGPFTIVPLNQYESSLVWVVTPDQADEYTALEPLVLNRIIEDKMHSILGKVEISSKIQTFPLSGMIADRMAEGRMFLIGEAGHVFPPIGAQGYNLGVRDIAALVESIDQSWTDQTNIARLYNSKRKTDVLSRTMSVDLFNRSLLSDFLPAQLIRSTSIFLMNEISPIRKLMMREGIAPGSGFRGLGEGIRNPFVSRTDNH